jgi:hypothetical protein
MWLETGKSSFHLKCIKQTSETVQISLLTHKLCFYSIKMNEKLLRRGKIMTEKLKALGFHHELLLI